MAKLEKPRRLTVDFLLDNNLPIWVYNKSNQLGMKGIVVINFTDAKGRGDRKVIPKTHLPICITEDIPPDMVRNSPDFRRYIGKQVLELVWPEDAEKMITPEDEADLRAAIEALERPNAGGARMEPNDQKMDLSNANIPGNIPGVTQLTDNAFTIEAEPEDALHARILHITESVVEGTMKPRAGLMELKAIQEELKMNDFSYVLSRISDPTIQTWAKKKISDSVTPPSGEIKVSSSAAE